MARPRRPDAAPLARAGRGRVLRDVLLRLGDALLPGPRAVRARRPHADARGAGALRVLARLGAAPAAAAADRHRRRPRGAPLLGVAQRHRVRRPRVRARRRGRDPAPASVRREQLAERPREPRRVADALALVRAELADAEAGATLDGDGRGTHRLLARPSSACSGSSARTSSRSRLGRARGRLAGAPRSRSSADRLGRRRDRAPATGTGCRGSSARRRRSASSRAAADGRPAADLRQAGARRRVRPAQRRSTRSSSGSRSASSTGTRPAS